MGSEGENWSSALSFEAFVPLQGERTTSAAREAWGVKWDASDAWLMDRSRGAARYSFDTPWGPPIRFLEATSCQFPTLRFGLAYLIPQIDGTGFLVVAGGQIVSEEHVSDSDPDMLDDFCAKASGGESLSPEFGRQLASRWLNPGIVWPSAACP